MHPHGCCVTPNWGAGHELKGCLLEGLRKEWGNKDLIEIYRANANCCC